MKRQIEFEKTNEEKQKLGTNVKIEKGTTLQTLWHKKEIVFDVKNAHCNSRKQYLNNFKIKTLNNILIELTNKNISCKTETIRNENLSSYNHKINYINNKNIVPVRNFTGNLLQTLKKK